MQNVKPATKSGLFDVPSAYNEAAAEQDTVNGVLIEDEEIRVREISNGFVSTKSWREKQPGDDKCWDYRSIEIYYAENPIKDLPAAGAKA